MLYHCEKCLDCFLLEEELASHICQDHVTQNQAPKNTGNTPQVGPALEACPKILETAGTRQRVGAVTPISKNAYISTNNESLSTSDSASNHSSEESFLTSSRHSQIKAKLGGGLERTVYPLAEDFIDLAPEPKMIRKIEKKCEYFLDFDSLFEDFQDGL